METSRIMTLNAFYLAALILCAIGAALMWDTDPYTLGGGDTYRRKRARRLVGELLFLTAALSLGLAVIS